MKTKPKNKIRVEEFLYFFLFVSVFYVYSAQFLVQFSLLKLLFLRLSTVLFLLLWIYRSIEGSIKFPQKNILISTSLLMLWWVGTTFFALNISTALNGFFGRYNGLWSHLTFLLLFIISSSLPLSFKRIEKIIKFSVLSLVPISLYGLYQLLFINLQHSWSLERPFSTIGHPVIFAALLGLVLPFSLTFYLHEENKRKKTIWGLSTLIIVLASISTLSRGPWIGSAVAVGIVLKAYSKNKNLPMKRISIAVSMLLITVLIYTASNADFRSRLAERFVGDGSSSIKHRKLYLKSAINILKDYPVTGIGFDNFRIMYPFYRLPEDTYVRNNITPTMVHNGYLQSAVVNGIPGLILYIVLVFFVLRLLFKTRKFAKNEYWYILTAFIASIIGYLVQDFTGWLEVSLTPFFWIFMGLSVSLCNYLVRGEDSTTSIPETNNTPIVAVAVTLLVGAVLLFTTTIKNIYVDHLLWKSKQLIAGKLSGVEPDIVEILKNYPNDYYYEDVAGMLYVKKLIKDGERNTYAEGVKIIENAHLHNAYDPSIMIHRIQLDSVALKKGIISKPDKFTEHAIETVLAVDKYNPYVYEAVGRLRFEEKRFKKAGFFFDKAKKLRQSTPVM